MNQMNELQGKSPVLGRPVWGSIEKIRRLFAYSGFISFKITYALEAIPAPRRSARRDFPQPASKLPVYVTYGPSTGLSDRPL